MVIVEELVDSPGCEPGVTAGSNPVFHPKEGSQNKPCNFLVTITFFENLVAKTIYNMRQNLP